eukprot:m.85137 g.85137  ORF g.85137 m.85137 type:complete len:317 (-) comp14711_c1_seq1:127-1077(-)
MAAVSWTLTFDNVKRIGMTFDLVASVLDHQPTECTAYFDYQDPIPIYDGKRNAYLRLSASGTHVAMTLAVDRNPGLHDSCIESFESNSPLAPGNFESNPLRVKPNFWQEAIATQLAADSRGKPRCKLTLTDDTLLPGGNENTVALQSFEGYTFDTHRKCDDPGWVPSPKVLPLPAVPFQDIWTYDATMRVVNQLAMFAVEHPGEPFSVSMDADVKVTFSMDDGLGNSTDIDLINEPLHDRPQGCKYVSVNPLTAPVQYHNPFDKIAASLSPLMTDEDGYTVDFTRVRVHNDPTAAMILEIFVRDGTTITYLIDPVL